MRVFIPPKLLTFLWSLAAASTIRCNWLQLTVISVIGVICTIRVIGCDRIGVEVEFEVERFGSLIQAFFSCFEIIEELSLCVAAVHLCSLAKVATTGHTPGPQNNIKKHTFSILYFYC